MRLHLNRIFKTKGQAATCLNLFLSIGVLGIVAILAVELSRYLLAQDQLKSSVEAAALCCETTLASTGSPNTHANQIAAKRAGLSLFQQNSILGKVMTGATLISVAASSSPAFDVTAGEAQICFQFLDPVTRAPLGSSSSSGTLIQATGAYSYVPMFGQILGVGNAQFTFETSAYSGVPQLDVVILYDISAGQSYETPVTYVQRWWDDPVGTNYMLAYNSSNQPAQGYQAEIGIVTPPGTNNYQTWPNSLHPQMLEAVSNCSSPPLHFSEEPGSPLLGLAGIRYYGCPPGDCPFTVAMTSNPGDPGIPIGPIGPTGPTDPVGPHAGGGGGGEFSAMVNGTSFLFLGGSNINDPSGTIAPKSPIAGDDASDVGNNPSYANYFTDMIVNIDGNETFTNFSTSYNGHTYNFPCGAVLVEAARGNLDSSLNCTSANISLATMGLSSSDIAPGYEAAYAAAARKVAQPMNAMQNSVTGFMNQLATSSDVHFGLITFNDYVGADASTIWPSSNTTPDSSTVTAPNSISSDFNKTAFNTDETTSQTATYAVPNICLNPNSSSTASTIQSTLPTLTVAGNRNIAAALQAAVNELTSQTSGSPTYARPGANKVIILVTSGPPTVDLSDNSGTTAQSDALTQAQTANAAGIPVYCISVAQLTNDGTTEDTAYGGSSGIVATAGYGGKYYRVDWTNTTTTQTALTTAFANVSRQLITLVH